MPEKINNKPLIVEVNKKVHSLHQRLDTMSKDIELIKQHVIETNYKIPERKKGWFYDTWDSPQDLPKEDWAKLK